MERRATNPVKPKSGKSEADDRISFALKRMANKSSETPDAKRRRFSPSFSDFPSELVAEILKHVPSSHLVHFRQINRQWNECASKIMRHRSDIELRFQYEKDEFMHRIPFRLCEVLLVDGCRASIKNGSKSLTDLVECLAQSTNFPFTNFRFDGVSGWSNDLRSFLAMWGRSIATLNVNFVGKMPIQHIEFQFPELKVLGVNELDSANRGIVDKILRASSSLETFFVARPDKENDFGDELQPLTATILESLQSNEKLHCLKKAKIVMSSLMEYWLQQPANMPVHLQCLAFDSAVESNAVTIVNKLFILNKNHLQTLSIPNLELLKGLTIPKLKNLQKLRLRNHEESEEAMFPPLFDLAGTFPNVKELAFATKRDEIPRISNPPLNIDSNKMTNVEVLRLSFGFDYEGNIESFGFDYEGNIEFTEDDMKITPNVKTLLIDSNEERFCSNGHFNFKKMSENWPKLENLGWYMFVGSHHSLIHRMDAFLTGLPIRLCKEFAEKFRNKNRLSADEVSAYHLKREESSIMDLKELKRFDISMLMCHDDYESRPEFDYDQHCGSLYEHFDEAGFDRNHHLFRTGIGKVSQFLAFDQMPNLIVRTHKTID